MATRGLTALCHAFDVSQDVGLGLLFWQVDMPPGPISYEALVGLLSHVGLGVLFWRVKDGASTSFLPTPVTPFFRLFFRASPCLVYPFDPHAGN